MIKTEYLPFWNFALSPVGFFFCLIFRALCNFFPHAICKYSSSPFHLFIRLQLLDLCSFVPLLMIELLKNITFNANRI